jgi:hypothetical protein
MRHRRLTSARLSALLTEYEQLRDQIPHIAAEQREPMRRRLAELDTAVDTQMRHSGPGSTP